MKMTQIKYPLYFLLLQLLLSCQTVVEVELPAHEPKLVVNAVLNPDSLFTVDVSASQSAFSNETHTPVENAAVSLYGVEKHQLDLQHIGNGIYQADKNPQAQQYYELKVLAPGYPAASAVSYVPAAPLIKNVRAGVGPVREDWQGSSVIAYFTLEDAPEQENFYYLRVFTPETDHSGETYNRNVSIISSVPIEYEFSMETRLFFSDKLFNGQALRLILNLDNSPQKVTYVQIAHITKEYYHYVRTLEKQSYRDNTSLVPIPVTNNILNGMGLFGGYNATILVIEP